MTYNGPMEVLISIDYNSRKRKYSLGIDRNTTEKTEPELINSVMGQLCTFGVNSQDRVLKVEITSKANEALSKGLREVFESVCHLANKSIERHRRLSELEEALGQIKKLALRGE